MLSLTWGEAQLESEPSLNLQWNSCDSEKSKGPLELSMPAIACYSCSLAVHVDNRSAFLRGTTEEFWWGMRCHFGPLTCLCKLYERLRRIYPPILVPELTNETWTRLFWSLFWDACWRQQPNGCKGSLRHCVAVNMGVLLCIMHTYAYHQHCTVHFLLCDQSYLPSHWVLCHSTISLVRWAGTPNVLPWWAMAGQRLLKW